MAGRERRKQGRKEGKTCRLKYEEAVKQQWAQERRQAVSPSMGQSCLALGSPAEKQTSRAAPCLGGLTLLPTCSLHFWQGMPEAVTLTQPW